MNQNVNIALLLLANIKQHRVHTESSQAFDDGDYQNENSRLHNTVTHQISHNLAETHCHINGIDDHSNISQLQSSIHGMFVHILVWLQIANTVGRQSKRYYRLIIPAASVRTERCCQPDHGYTATGSHHSGFEGPPLVAGSASC